MLFPFDLICRFETNFSFQYRLIYLFCEQISSFQDRIVALATAYRSYVRRRTEPHVNIHLNSECNNMPFFFFSLSRENHRNKRFPRLMFVCIRLLPRCAYVLNRVFVRTRVVRVLFVLIKLPRLQSVKRMTDFSARITTKLDSPVLLHRRRDNGVYNFLPPPISIACTRSYCAINVMGLFPPYLVRILFRFNTTAIVTHTFELYQNERFTVQSVHRAVCNV